MQQLKSIVCVKYTRNVKYVVLQSEYIYRNYGKGRKTANCHRHGIKKHSSTMLEVVKLVNNRFSFLLSWTQENL